MNKGMTVTEALIVIVLVVFVVGTLVYYVVKTALGA